MTVEEITAYNLNKKVLEDVGLMEAVGKVLDELVLISSYPMLTATLQGHASDGLYDIAKSVSLGYFKWLAYPSVAILIMDEPQSTEVDFKRLWVTCIAEHAFISEVIDKVAKAKTLDFIKMSSNLVN